MQSPCLRLGHCPTPLGHCPTRTRSHSVAARGVTRAGFRATVAALWFFEMITRIGGYAWSGFYSSTVLLLFLMLLPLMWAGTVVGERLGNKVDSETFARVLAVMLLVSGLSLLAK